MKSSNFPTSYRETDENQTLVQDDLEETDVADLNEQEVVSEELLYSKLYIPKRVENPVITKLKNAGLYQKPLGKGKHQITCRWKNQHFGNRGGSAVYYEPSKPFSYGGFKCDHPQCSRRELWDLLESLGIRENEAKNQATIRLQAGSLDEVVDLCEQELAKSGKFYQRGKLIVTIVAGPGAKEAHISAVSIPSIVRALSVIVRFEKFDKRGLMWSCCDPIERHCRMLCEADHYPHLPILHGLTRQPYFRRDGSLVTEPGYDKETGFFGDFLKYKFGISTAPSRQQAEYALAELDSLLRDFNFKTVYDRSAALAAILTAAIRPSLPVAPMFHCRAPEIGSGKSYLTNLFATFATASGMSGTTFPAGDEECRKLLLASLLTSPPVICFDNLTSDLRAYKSLCLALTEEYLTGRILGISKMATVSTRTLFLSNGNNVGPVQDMSRRVIPINLDACCEIPAQRIFKQDPLAMVHGKRGYYVSQALTIIRAWIVAGRPIKKVKSLATYNEWSDLCRQPLLWLGCPDPAENIFLSMEQDPDRETLGRLLHAWDECFNSRPIMIREAISRASNELLEVFMDIAGDRGNLNNKRLGKWISRHSGRIVDGLKFAKDSSTRSAEAWKAESATSVS